MFLFFSIVALNHFLTQYPLHAACMVMAASQILDCWEISCLTNQPRQAAWILIAADIFMSWLDALEKNKQ